MYSSKLTKVIDFQYIKNDLPAGIVVFLVALPLCLGIALASGAPLFAGIISGVVGGIVVAFVSGSQISVSGPAAGLTVIVINSITQLGSYETFLLSLLIAGVLQILLGYLKAGIIGYYFPSSVIKGMLAAIGIILVLKQIPHALGYDKDNEGDFYFIQMDGQNTFSELVNSINYVHPGAICISIISLFIIVLWDRPSLKQYSFFRFVPGALIVVIMGIALNEIFKVYIPQLMLEGEELVQLPVSKSISDFARHFTFPDFSGFGNYKIYVVAGTIAVVASLESLLSIEAADKLDPLKRITPVNRELKAQGLGNTISALLGGLPLTAVIVRTSANANAGGKTKLACIIHGLLLLLSVIALTPLLNKIPLACLASVLLVVGYKLARIPLFISMFRLGWIHFVPFIVTVVAIQFTDLLKGITAGMIVSAFIVLRNNYKLSYTVHSIKNNGIDNAMVIQLAEDVSFLNKSSIATRLYELAEGSYIVIDGSHTRTLDDDVVELIHNFKNNVAPVRNITVELKHIPETRGMAAH